MATILQSEVETEELGGFKHTLKTFIIADQQNARTTAISFEETAMNDGETETDVITDLLEEKYVVTTKKELLAYIEKYL